MKKLLLLAAVTLIGLAILFKVGLASFDKTTYIDQNVLDMASPLNVSIDIEFLKKLNPAYEQQ
jgi:hypothetical protein